VFLNFGGDGYEVNPFGGDDEEYTAQAKEVSRAMGTAWINFVTSLDPNGKSGLPNGTIWPGYSSLGGVGKGLVLDLGEIFVEDDGWREEGIAWFIKYALSVFGN
jgi:carboxylesterase type B